METSTRLRLTPQRSAVLDVLTTSRDHPTAAEVYERVRELSPGIGPATVYRALGFLVERGYALELTLDGGAAARYDANTARHDHLVCQGCGRAEDVDSPVPAGVVDRVSHDTGFSISGYALQYHGLCPQCQASA